MHDLEAQIRRLVGLMYDTGVSLEQLETDVCPLLAPDILFVDPLIRAQGFAKFRTGMRGFHCAFVFDFTIHQMRVEAHRAVVEGTMNLRSIPGYCYPLRTVLVYEYTVAADGRLRIHSLEEMWTIGDLFANAPLGIGFLYDRVFRRLSGAFFVGFFWLATAVRGGRVRKNPIQTQADK